MTLHGLDVGLLALLCQFADHPATFAVPLVQLLLLGVLDLPAVVFAVDRALAKLAGEDVISFC